MKNDVPVMVLSDDVNQVAVSVNVMILSSHDPKQLEGKLLTGQNCLRAEL